MTLPPFHLAFPVDDLAAARRFYGEVMGCAEGRSSDEWIDFDFHGHQIVAHLAPGQAGDRASNHVDGHGVPVPHFGLVMGIAEWEALAERLRAGGCERSQLSTNPNAARPITANGATSTSSAYVIHNHATASLPCDTARCVAARPTITSEPRNSRPMSPTWWP